MERKFYVYHYLREDGRPYYVGKGSGRRAFVNSGKPCGTPPKHRIVFIQTGLTENEAFDLERGEISRYGRVDNGTGILRNKSDGGQGRSGKETSEETRRLRSVNQLGKRHSIASKEKMSMAKSRRKYKITCPNGSIVESTSLTKFAREHQLSFQLLYSTFHGNQSHHKGYRVE